MAKETVEGFGNDVQIIREILFGEQMKLMQGKIEALEKEISSLKGETSRLKKELQGEKDSRQKELQALTGLVDQSAAAGEQKLGALSEKLAQRIETDHQTVTSHLSEVETNLEKKIQQVDEKADGMIAEYQRFHDGLIGSLASALSKLKAEADS